MSEQRPSQAGRSAPAEPLPGERLVRMGAVIGAIGVVASLLALLPLVVDSAPSASWLWFIAVGGVSVGSLLAIWGVVRAARARSRYLASD